MKKKKLLAQLLPMLSPDSVFAEVRHILGLMGGVDDPRLIKVFVDVRDLYQGIYPGYRGCNTLYHDLRHTTDVFLALARLLHGAYLTGVSFEPGDIVLALTSTLMHDTGYIQKTTDRKGTGGKYTLTHVDRSVGFLSEYLPRQGFTAAEVALCKSFVQGTSISVDISKTSFTSPAAALIARMIATADLLGQIADRIYLEKLLFLFREFREAGISGYDSELDLLTKTIGFYETMQQRLEQGLDNVQKYMAGHFSSRWQIDADLYQEAIAHNISYLNQLLTKHRKDYRQRLKREGVVARLESIEKSETYAAQRKA